MEQGKRMQGKPPSLKSEITRFFGCGRSSPRGQPGPRVRVHRLTPPGGGQWAGQHDTRKCRNMEKTAERDKETLRKCQQHNTGGAPLPARGDPGTHGGGSVTTTTGAWAKSTPCPLWL